jgi:competence protein ComEA
MKSRTLFPILILNMAIVASAQTNLPNGDGKELVQRICNQCHDLENIVRSHLSKARWSQEVDDMVARGAEGTDDQFDQIVDYLSKNFGPAKKTEQAPQINVNMANAAELASALGVSNHDASAIVEYREKNGKFKQWTDLKNVPGLDIKKIEENKDRLLF